jgi:hypothetical protein
MYEVHRSYKYTVQRRDGLLLLLEFVVIVAGEGDSCVKKKESASAELNRRGSCSEWVWRTELKREKNRQRK